MALTNVFITVKTYPSLSKSYTELVCTAGFLEDGSMIRIYPVPFRFLKEYMQYKKYQWINIDIKKRTKDFRPESYSPVDITKGFTLGELIPSKNWNERKKIVLKNVYYNFTQLIKEAKDKQIRKSLAVLKPKEILDFKAIPDNPEWNKDTLAIIKSKGDQLNLFANNVDNNFKIVRKVPYKFKYHFRTEGSEMVHKIMIEDWEVGVLYWKYIDAGFSEQYAIQKIRNKYFDEFITRDLYFYVGTSQANHLHAINPFMIIGIFTPPLELKVKKEDSQQSLFWK